jgi:hypothetical protein
MVAVAKTAINPGISVRRRISLEPSATLYARMTLVYSSYGKVNELKVLGIQQPSFLAHVL